jgi:glycosyltransferase involved in cell wall biosynthesis
LSASSNALSRTPGSDDGSGSARPLRIAQLLESDGPGGAEVVLLQLSQELRRRGHEVIHIGPARGTGWLGGVMRDDGFTTDTFTLTRPIDFRCMRDLAATLARHRVDVAHSHEFTMCVYGAAAAGRAGVEHVTTMHGNQSMMDRLRRRVALRWAFRRSRLVVACSAATGRDVEKGLGLEAGRLHVIRNGVPERPGRRAPIRAELGVSAAELLIAAVGNVVHRKGHLKLLQALALVEDRHGARPWRVAIAGDRRDAAPAIDAFLEERGWQRRVHLLGAREDVPDLLAAADIFAMPSLWEGLPLAVLEAMFAALPIVASETSGIPEAISSAQVGLLAPPGDVPALAAHLRALLDDAELRRRLGQAARVRALAEFTVAAMTDRYLAAYRGVRA